MIYGEIACDGKDPGLKGGAAIEGFSAFHDPQPGFLHQVVDVIAATEEEYEIADEAKLKALHEIVEQYGISGAQSPRDELRLGLHGTCPGNGVLQHTGLLRVGKPELCTPLHGCK